MRSLEAKTCGSSHVPWFVQPRTEEAEENSHENLQLPHEGGMGVQMLISLVISDRTEVNGVELQQEKVRLNIRKRFFTERVTGHWNRLPQDVLMAPSL